MARPKTGPVKGSGAKVSRGNASQFFVAGELCRRGWVAVVTLGNTPNTDILVSDPEGTQFVHIQVKTFRPGDRTVAVGRKAEKNYGERFIWVLAGIPEAHSDKPFRYFIIPASVMAERVPAANNSKMMPCVNSKCSRLDCWIRSYLVPSASKCRRAAIIIPKYAATAC